MSHDRFGRRSLLHFGLQEREGALLVVGPGVSLEARHYLDRTLICYIDEIAIVARRYAAIWVKGGYRWSIASVWMNLLRFANLSSSIALNHD